MYTITINDIRTALDATSARSAWVRGVRLYAEELLETLCENHEKVDAHGLEAALLNGASCWVEYSEGGCALCYDTDIAERLCSPSELRRCNGGRWNPSRDETWLDVQARALAQAAQMILDAAEEARKAAERAAHDEAVCRALEQFAVEKRQERKTA